MWGLHQALRTRATCRDGGTAGMGLATLPSSVAKHEAAREAHLAHDRAPKSTSPPPSYEYSRDAKRVKGIQLPTRVHPGNGGTGTPYSGRGAVHDAAKSKHEDDTDENGMANGIRIGSASSLCRWTAACSMPSREDLARTAVSCQLTSYLAAVR